MSDKNIFSERERGIEAEYFLKREQELIAKMRERWEPLPAEFEPVSFCIYPGARTTA